MKILLLLFTALLMCILSSCSYPNQIVITTLDASGTINPFMGRTGGLSVAYKGSAKNIKVTYANDKSTVTYGELR